MKGGYPKPEVVADLTRPNFGDKSEDIRITQKHLDEAELLKEAGVLAQGEKAADLRIPDLGVD